MHIIVGNKVYRKIKYFLKLAYRFSIKKETLKVFGNKDKNFISKVYVINLDRQTDRLKRFKKETKRQKLDNKISLHDIYERISAIDGKKFDLNQAKDIVNDSYPLTAQYYVDPNPQLLEIIKKKDINVELYPEEIAVALSHINIWKKIVEHKISYALILEDDIFFEKKFTEQLNLVWEELSKENEYKCDILYLSYQEVNHGSMNTHYSKHLNKLHRGYWWLSGYVLSYSAAKFLLDKLPVIGPIDLWLNNYFGDLDVYATKTPIISQRKDLNSDNRYSILPVLSQIGIQSDKTHLLLEEKKGKYPVFCIGYNQNESEKLETVLSICSYRCYNDKVSDLSQIIQKFIINNIPLLFDAYINVDCIDNEVVKLNDLYPNAIFIFPIEYNIPKNLPKDKYMFLDISKEVSWKRIIKFLSCKTPSVTFPLNQNQDVFKFKYDEYSMNTNEFSKNIKILEHDVNPWIIPFERLADYGISKNRHVPRWLRTTEKSTIDNFNIFDTKLWIPLENTFPTNLTMFKKENISIEKNNCLLKLKKEKYKSKNYTSASFVSKKSFLYGRFEATMKVAKTEGIISAFFLHRNNPWQEIDIEILGNDTSKLLINVYFNPGEEGTKLNFGNRGTPMFIDLGFDASEDFHTYTIEWEPYEIRWYVDNQLIAKRAIWEPTPIPKQPMNLYCSIWSSESDSLAGALSKEYLPQVNEIKSIRIHEWVERENI